MLAAAPAAVSFTFGLPGPDVVRALQAAGSTVLLTVTTPEEAVRALQLEPDALCLQGAEAGAHRGSLRNDDRPDEDRPLHALLAAVRRRTLVPLVAAGGVGTPGDVVDLVARGAHMVQAGTAFLRCPESGAPSAQKDALVDPAFAATAARVPSAGGGPVRSSTPWCGTTPARRPPIPRSTTPRGRSRAAAARAGESQRMSLYAGTAFRQAEARPAAEVVERLVSGLRR